MTKKSDQKSKAKAADENPKSESTSTTEEVKVDKPSESTTPPPPVVESENPAPTEEPVNKMSFNEAKELLSVGAFVKLPEWEGFWFADIENPENIYVFTKDNQILDNPMEIYKERNDWEITDSTSEQQKILSKFWTDLENEKIQKENQAQHQSQLEEYQALYVVAYNKGRNTSFKKHSSKEKILITDLENRKNVPTDSNRDSEFLMSNGFIFDYESGQLTSKQESQTLKSFSKDGK